MKALVVPSYFCLCFAFSQPVNAQPSASTSEDSGLVSPDKQWEYKAPSAGEDARIVKAGSDDMAISLVDPSTLTIYSSLAMRVHRQNGEDVGEGYGADVLFTIKFDAAGRWKIIKAHQISEKEAEKYEQEN